MALVAAFIAFDAMAQPKPALVRDVDEPGRDPYLQFVRMLSTDCTPSASACNVDFAPVPVGKRLVLSFASILFFLDASSPALGGVVSVTTNVASATRVFLPTPQLTVTGSPSSSVSYTASGPIVYYVEPGGVPRVQIETTLKPLGSFIEVNLAGYYVTLP